MDHYEFMRTITPNYCVERVPRALGRYIVHRTICNHKINNIDVVGQSVSDLPPLDWARQRMRGPVIACARCMSEQARRVAGSWPPPNYAAENKINSPKLREPVFVKGTDTFAFPADYVERTNQGCVIRLAGGSRKRLTVPPSYLYALFYGLWNYYLVHRNKALGDVFVCRYLGIDPASKSLTVEYVKTGVAHLADFADLDLVIGDPG